VLFWSAYQSGSTQTSATQPSLSCGEGLASAVGVTAAASGVETGRGIEPVVKS
jgi:hypothetical protein